MKQEKDSLKEEFYVRLTEQKKEILQLEKEKGSFLESLQEKDQEISFYEELMDVLFSKKDQKIIRRQWTINKNKIPLDLFKEKEIKLADLYNSAVLPDGLDINGNDFKSTALQNKLP